MADKETDTPTKVAWFGRVLGVQPRIRLMRSFDERHHGYQGYVLQMDGTCGAEAGKFTIAVGKAANEKHKFKVGMHISGFSAAVSDPSMETAGFHKTSGIKVEQGTGDASSTHPPFHGTLPDLETYRTRGHLRLDARTYEAKCTTCIWGCKMPVEMVIDQWNPSQRQYRFETFCYGPKNCTSYRAGAARKVPGRKGMTYTEENWVDEDATAHRGEDE